MTRITEGGRWERQSQTGLHGMDYREQARRGGRGGKGRWGAARAAAGAVAVSLSEGVTPCPRCEGEETDRGSCPSRITVAERSARMGRAAGAAPQTPPRGLPGETGRLWPPKPRREGRREAVPRLAGG